MLLMNRAATLATELRRRGLTDVLTDSTSRSAFSSDASLYRVPPLLVARPRSAEDVATAVELCARHEIPLTARGAGTSVAGNAVGPGLVLDFSRHMRKVLHVDPEARTAVVQPGVVQAELQRAAAPHGLRFGPDPSTHTRCTIGGMIGNNACGSRTLGYGRTSDNVAALKAVTGNGTVLDLTARLGEPGAGAPAELTALHELANANLATIRTEFGRFGRQVSGYALEHLLPERRFDVARLLVGSEGTLAVLTEATVTLVTDPAHRVLVVLGYDDIAAAGDAAPTVLKHLPTACEGIDARIVDVVRTRRGPCRRCRAGPRGCSSRSRGTTRPRCSSGPGGWPPATTTPSSSPTRRGPRRCGASGRTARACPAAAPPGCPHTAAGRTRRCPRRCWAATCATSRR
jgi:FAD/FMN-containing dehydrogenase